YHYHIISSLFIFPSSHTSTFLFFFFNNPAPTEIYTLSLHDALPICNTCRQRLDGGVAAPEPVAVVECFEVVYVDVQQAKLRHRRSEEHTSELQSLRHLVCRLLLEKKKKKKKKKNMQKKKQIKKR